MMYRPESTIHGDPRAAEFEQVVKVCDSFEAEWRQGHQPRIEEFLARNPSVSAVDLFRELLALELELARASESVPTVDEYRARFPDRIELLDAVFAEAASRAGINQPRPGRSRAEVGPILASGAGERFRILRFHREGGLGRVYLARDEELGREVALKEIRPDKAAEADLRSRFVLEAEINGGLEHPGIVPVYSLGAHDDGRPFYAMRFVEGDSFKETIDSYHKECPRPDPTAVEFRKLLGRFIDVCEAIAFAHSKGVLHRDLKPHNVMLGRFGETLLIDWGLAKATGRREPGNLDAAGAATLVPPSGSGHAPTLGALGSPLYMSPEQATGAADSLGPATDVYGLGAILFALLTGKPPVEGGTIDEILDRVRRGAIRLPRSLNPSIPRALEAVCLKALAPQPADRYPTAMALAEEVEHWLADEPVTAWREPPLIHARRWMRRHRTLVTSTVAAMLVSLIALGFAYSRESAINGRLARIIIERDEANTNLVNTNSQLDGANQRLLAANSSLVEASGRVTKAKAEADARLDQTLQAIEDYYTGVGEEVLLGQKEFHSLRQRLLEKPRRFYERLAEELGRAESTDSRAKVVLAKGRFGLGKILYTLGILDDAGTQFAAAASLYRDLVSSDPDRLEYRNGLAWCNNKLGNVQRFTGHLASAAEFIEKAATGFSELEKVRPSEPEYQVGSAGNYYNLGVVKGELGDFRAAVDAHREAITKRIKLATERPGVPEYQQSLALSYGSLGYVLAKAGDLKGAADAYRRSIPLRTKLVTDFPNVPTYQFELAWVLTNVGYLQYSTGDPRTAAETQRQAIAISAKLTAAQPNVPAYQSNWAAAFMSLGMAQSSYGDLKGAIESNRDAIAIWTRLNGIHPTTPYYQHKLAWNYANLAIVQRDARDHAAAANSTQQAMAIWPKLVTLQSDFGENQHGMAISFTTLGDLQRDQGDRDTAAASYREAIAILSKLVAGQPDSPEYLCSLATSCTKLGDLLRDRGDLDDAVASISRAINIGTKIVDNHPDVSDYLSTLGVALDSLGRVREFQSRYIDAEQAFRQAIERQQIAFEKAPQVLQFRRFLSGHYANLVETLRALERPEDALAVAQHRRTLCNNNPAALYNLARDNAFCVSDAHGEARKQSRAAEAVATLRAAVAAGWRDAALTSRDPDLATLHDRDDFQNLRAEMFDRGFPADPFAR
jgi:eukaryotic-like serine/threonine-protein kinase